MLNTTYPSYRGQILVLTYPMQGNHGVPAGPCESERVQVAGLVIARLAVRPTHEGMRQDLAAWLRAAGVPALEGVDTRAITRRLRASATMRGGLRGAWSNAGTAPVVDMTTVAQQVTAAGITEDAEGARRVLVIDCGTKRSIVASLRERGLAVVRAAFSEPWGSRSATARRTSPCSTSTPAAPS